MATVEQSDTQEDTMIVEGNRIIEMSRVIWIKDLAAHGTDWQWAAVDATGILVWGIHPSRTFMRAVSYHVQGISPGRAKVAVRYINSTAQYFGGSSTLERIDTDMDRNGTVITVTNKGAPKNPTTDTTNSDGSNTTGTAYTSADDDPQPGVITVTAPIGTFTVRRIEANVAVVPGGINPLAVKEQYTNYVNSGEFLERYSPGTALCEAVAFDNDGLGDVAYNMQYEFRTKDSGWKPEVIWINKETGEPGVGLVQDVGRKTVDYYQETDFSPLGFS